MEAKCETTPLKDVQADWLVVAVVAKTELRGASLAVDQATQSLLTRLSERDDLPGRNGELVKLLDIPELQASRLMLVGLGSESELNRARYSRALRAAAISICGKPDQRVAVAIEGSLADELDEGVQAELAAMAFQLGGQGPGLHKSEPDRYPLQQLAIVSEVVDGAAVDRGAVLGAGINAVRNFVNQTPDELYPESFADQIEQLATDVGLECTVLDHDQLVQQRMGSLLAVARGSARPARVVVLKHQGAGESDPVLGLVGKGVTFDSGGLSLKPNDSMAAMKCDMAGAATVVGAMATIARLNLPANVIGLVGLVENMPSGTSYKLGDVLTARNGTTIEVMNTDAEGRLVLADVLDYAVELGATCLVDLATLTGACVVALGNDVTGVFSNHDSWAQEVIQAGRAAGEQLWQLPTYDSYAEQLKSDVADCKNVGTRWGGAITAAKFLEKFVSDRPWVHLDIAGPSFADSSKTGQDAGGTGCMLAGLVELVRRQQFA